MRQLFAGKMALSVVICSALMLYFLIDPCLPARAQEQAKKPAPKASPTPMANTPAAAVVVRALTKEENEKWTLLVQAESVYNGTINRIVTEAVRVAIDRETSKDVHGAIKEAYGAFSLSITERKATLAQWRLDSDCKDCVVLNGSLVRPAPTPAPEAAPPTQK